MPTCTPIVTEPRPYGYQEIYRFPNGLGASVCVYDDPYAFNAKFGVLKIQFHSRNSNRSFCPDPSSYVLARATRGEVDLTLASIQSLPTPEDIYG